MDNNQFQDLASRYYKRIAKIIYGADYFLTNTEQSEDVVLGYCNLINNVNADYSNMKRAKQQLALPMHNFSEVTDFQISPEKSLFVIHDGKVCGDVESARNYSRNILNSYKDKCTDQAYNRLYELALYIYYCIKDETRETIPFPDSFFTGKDAGENVPTTQETFKKEDKVPKIEPAPKEEIVKVITPVSASTSAKETKPVVVDMFAAYGFAAGLN